MFYWLPWPLSFALLFAPYTILRTVGYYRWKGSGEDPDVLKRIRNYRSLKPEKYWVPSLVLWIIQLCWAMIVLFPFQYI
ncbi:MAG: hypothetical protein Q8J92_09615 [Parvibaculum sp.]|nr:hypothetical protein [Parvibaculum sp.]